MSDDCCGSLYCQTSPNSRCFVGGIKQFQKTWHETFLKHDNILWLVLYFMEPIKVRQKQERMATDSLLAEKMSTIFNVRGVFLDYGVILPNRRVFVDIFTSYSHSLSYPDQAIKISALNVQRKIITIRLVGRANNWNKW